MSDEQLDGIVYAERYWPGCMVCELEATARGVALEPVPEGETVDWRGFCARHKGFSADGKINNAAFSALCRTLAPTALLYTLSVMADATARQSDRLRAAETIINRAYGMPPQAITGGEDGAAPLRVEIVEVRLAERPPAEDGDEA